MTTWHPLLADNKTFFLIFFFIFALVETSAWGHGYHRPVVNHIKIGFQKKCMVYIIWTALLRINFRNSLNVEILSKSIDWTYFYIAINKVKDGCLCLSSCNTLIVLPPLIEIAFKHTLQWAVCSLSDSTNADQLHAAKDIGPFFQNKLFLPPCCFVVLSRQWPTDYESAAERVRGVFKQNFNFPSKKHY